MGKPIKSLRTRLGLTQEQIAHELGVAKTQISKWERGWEPMPPHFVKELALQYCVGAEDVLDYEREADEWPASPYAVVSPDDLFGTLSLRLANGVDLDLPISVKARASLLPQLNNRNFLSDPDAGSSAWLDFWTMDDRTCFVRCEALIEINFRSDDCIESPPYSHPEVYRLAGQIDEYSDELPEVGPRLQEAFDQHLVMMGGLEASHTSATQAKFIFNSGRVSLVECNSPEAATTYVGLDMAVTTVPHDTFLQVGDMSDFHEASFINLDHVSFFSLPSEAYHRATAG